MAPTKKKTHKRKKSSSTKKAAPDMSASIAVYVILGILVIGTSFYTGYLVGSAGESGMETQTGSEGIDKLTIVEYSDFQCPFCSRAAPTVNQLKETYGDKAKVVFKHFPLESIHPQAFGAAVASECVMNEGGEDAFWEYHDTLFANQGALDTASLKKYATDQGVNIDSCLDNQETADKVRADMAEARQRGVSGTPSFWVHDELVVGAVPFATIAAKVDEKLSGAPSAAPPPAAAPPSRPTGPVDMDAGNFILGNPDADVLLVEFTDYQCPFCKRAHDQSYAQVKTEYIDTGKVRYSVRHFPLPMHPDAAKASEAVECAGKVGGADAYWEYHETLFENQQSLGIPNLKQYAADQGLDTGAFDSCLDSGEFTDLVKSDLSAGSAGGVGGTPSFFVNGNIIVGAQPFTSFQTAIDAELQ